jgi:hypothetical protein
MASPKRLTDIGIKNLPTRTKRYEVPDPGARGLYVVVHPSGKTSFAVRYRHADLPRKLTLQGGVSLAAARKLCADALHDVAQGRDPVESKKAHKAQTAAAAVNTVQFVCEEFLRREGGGLRTRNPDVAERCLGHSLGSVRAIYDRHGFENEMLHAFEALSAQIDRIVNGDKKL